MEGEQPKSWLSRNWKWFLPVGCVGSLLLLAGFAFGIMAIVFGVMKSSDAYKEAVSKAKANPAVVASLGDPIEEGYFAMGNLRVTGPSGYASLAIPISGPKGSATVYVEASKSAGKWTFSTLQVQVENAKERIDLLEPPLLEKKPEY